MSKPKPGDTADIGLEFAIIYRFSWMDSRGFIQMKMFICTNQKEMDAVPFKEYIGRKNLKVISYADVIEDKIYYTFFDQRIPVDRLK